MKISKKYNKREMTEKFLSSPKIKVGKNWMEEVDTLEHDDMLKRNRLKK